MSNQAIALTCETSPWELSDAINHLGCFYSARMVRLSGGEPEEVWTVSSIDGVVDVASGSLEDIDEWRGLIALVVNTDSVQLIAGAEVAPIFSCGELSWIAIIERGAQ